MCVFMHTCEVQCKRNLNITRYQCSTNFCSCLCEQSFIGFIQTVLVVLVSIEISVKQ